MKDPDQTQSAGSVSKLDNLTFYSMLSILQGGMWLLNDLEKYLKPFGLSQGRFSILLSVAEARGESMNPDSLALITGKSRPTVSSMMERLRLDELISIWIDPEDKRRRILEVTLKATKLLEEIIPEYNERIRRMSSNLSDDEKKQLMNIISRVNFLDPLKKISVHK